jgi:hypothetical protein
MNKEERRGEGDQNEKKGKAISGFTLTAWTFSYVVFVLGMNSRMKMARIELRKEKVFSREGEREKERDPFWGEDDEDDDEVRWMKASQMLVLGVLKGVSHLLLINLQGNGNFGLGWLVGIELRAVKAFSELSETSSFLIFMRTLSNGN